MTGVIQGQDSLPGGGLGSGGESMPGVGGLGEALPFTGFSTIPLVIAGLVSVAVGAVSNRLGRSRQSRLQHP